LNQARYLKVVDDGDVASGQYSGFDLDAIKFFHATGIEETTRRPAFEPLHVLTAYPNPFRHSTNIRYTIHDPGCMIQENPKPELTIYDATGRLVRQWDYPTMRLSGRISWDGTDHASRLLPSGVYILMFQTGESSETKKLLLIR